MRRGTRALIALGMLLLGWVAVAETLAHRAAASRTYVRAEDVPVRRTAIVLGARVHRGGALSSTLADRVDCALALYRAGKVQRILVSGDHGSARYDEVNAMADALTGAQVAPSAVFLDHAGFRTLDTMHRAHDVFRVSEAVVCTQAFHMPRALWLAQHFGIDAVGLVADARYPRALRDRVRERVAVSTALLDLVVGRSARLLGAPHPIDGDAASTRDRAAAR